MAKKNQQVVPEIIDSVEGLNAKMAAMREAQKIFATYTQEQVDKIFFAAASAANKMRLPLAKMAVEETGMGVVEDKVIKNNYAAEYIYNTYKNTKTVGVIEEDKEYGIKKIAEPIGLIAAVIPTTNPTSTAIFKALISLKTRNAIIISPHPRAKKCTIGNLDLGVLAPAGIGALVTIVCLAKAINALFTHFYSYAFHAIVGIVIAATLVIIPFGSFAQGVGPAVANIVCLAVGVAAALALDTFNQSVPKEA